MADQLAGCVALVTGGTRGFGRATALALARAGADVAVGYRAGEEEAASLRREIADAGGRAETFAADLSLPGAAADLRRPRWQRHALSATSEGRESPCWRRSTPGRSWRTNPYR